MADESPKRTISLKKGKHTFYFRYRAGEEPLIIKAIDELVVKQGLPFDSFDAAIMISQVNTYKPSKDQQ